MSEFAGPDRAAARLQAALDRIARAADRRHNSGAGSSDLAARLRATEAAAEAKARRTREIASRLDALIEELRSSLED